VGDDYIRFTVFLAAVLFLVGIASTFKLPTVRYVLICVGAVLLLLATALILRQPGIPT
jgi:NADH:ubiquinone oxidoreductase subunit K